MTGVPEAGEVELTSMELLPDELLKCVFRNLRHFQDTLRARAVCRRWRSILTPREYSTQFRESSRAVQSWCPLVFKRTPEEHEWCGYDSWSSSWQSLPALVNLERVDIRPLAGNGQALIGFKSRSEHSQVVVGDPTTSQWNRIPESTERWGEVGNILLVDHHHTQQDSSESSMANSFQIVAVRENATEVFQSSLGAWTKLRHQPPKGVDEITVFSIRDKLISATLCNNFLYCYGMLPVTSTRSKPVLVSYDVPNELWTDDCIDLPPHATSKCCQTLECAGNLFTAIEDTTRSTVAIWGLASHRKEFVGPMVEMPPEFYHQLCSSTSTTSSSTSTTSSSTSTTCSSTSTTSSSTSTTSFPTSRRRKQCQLQAVGHQHRIFLWKNFSNPQTLSIVVFDILLREWEVLPPYEHAIGFFPKDVELLQIFVDTGSFTPKFKLVADNHGRFSLAQ